MTTGSFSWKILVCVILYWILLEYPSFLQIMSPQLKGRGGHIAFGAEPVGISHCLHSYLLNQWVGFDQTCTDTLLGGRKEVIRFWWPWLYFQGHTSTSKFSNFYQNLCTPYLLNQMMDSGQTSYIKRWDGLKIWYDIGDLDQIFKVTTL